MLGGPGRPRTRFRRRCRAAWPTTIDHGATAAGSGVFIEMIFAPSSPMTIPIMAPSVLSVADSMRNWRQDVLSPRAERFPNADFVGSFGDRHEHDVHDHHAADDEADAGQRGADDGHRALDALEERERRRRRLHHEVVGNAWPDVPVRAQCLADELHDVVHHHRARRLHEEPADVAARVGQVGAAES